MKLSHQILALLLCASCSVAIAAPKKIDGIVAIINNDVITSSEVQHQTNLVKRQLQHDHQPLPNDQELHKQVLNHIVDINLQLQMAKKAGIQITDLQLNTTIQKIAERNHLTVDDMKSRLAKENISYDDYKDNVQKELLIAELQRETISKNIQISDEEVRRYMFEQQPQKSVQLYHIQDIVIPVVENPTPENIQEAETRANDVLKKLRAGEDFKTLAITESQSPNALSGGDLGFRALQDLPEVFTGPVQTLKNGDIAGPIRTGNGFHLIKLLETKQENASNSNTMNFDAAREALFRRQFEERIENWIQQLRAHAYIKILANDSATV